MSLYRESRRRSPLLLVGVGLAVGLLVGVGVGRQTAPEPSLESQIESVRADARIALDALDLVAIHYGQGAEEGEALEPAEAAVAARQLEELSARIEGLERRLEALDPTDAKAVEQARAALESAVAERRAKERVAELTSELDAALRQATGLG